MIRRIGAGESVPIVEAARKRRDGSPVDISLSVSAIRSTSGAIIGASMISRDITEANRTREALNRETEERQRIFETSQDLILVTDTQGVLVQVSPSSKAILGYAPEEMIGHGTVRFIYSDDLNNTRDEMRAARRRNHTRNFDTRFIHSSGRIVNAVVDGRMVRAGAPALLHRPGHDRKPDRAGSVARERATGARHHRYRARRLRPDEGRRHRLGLEFAGGNDVRLVAQRGARQASQRIDHPGAPPRRP